MPRARRTAAAPAPEPEPEVVETEEGGSRKRGPGKLAELHCAWIKDVYGVDIDPEALYLAQSTRRQFREDPESGYAEYIEERDAAKEAAASRKAAKEDENEDEAEEAPKPTARRGRKATPAPAAEETEDAPAPKPAARSRARKTAAPAAEVATEDAPAAAPRSRSRKAPF